MVCELSELSDPQFCVVVLKVEFLAYRRQHTWGLLVEVINVIFKLALALIIGQVVRECLGITSHFGVLLVKELVILFVHKHFVPGLMSEGTKGLQQLKRKKLGHD